MGASKKGVLCTLTKLQFPESLGEATLFTAQFTFVVCKECLKSYHDPTNLELFYLSLDGRLGH